MTRQTSIETYYKIKDEGLLSDLRFRVYDIIYSQQPVTISQMIKKATAQVINTGSFTGRISELKQMDLIYEHHEGKCPVTGRNVIFWATTDNLPKDYVRPPTRKEKKEFILQKLRELYHAVPQKGLISEIATLIKEL